MKAEAMRRGKDGVDEPVIYQGEAMGAWVKDGRIVSKDTPDATLVPLTVKRYSDALLTLLLKAHSPMFRDITRHEMTGADGGPIQSSVSNDLLSSVGIDQLRTLAAVLQTNASAGADAGGSGTGQAEPE